MHLVITYNGTTLKIYKNNIIFDANSHSAAYVVDNQLFIGGANEPYTYTGFFNGKIDDIRIYNRALNEQEIQTLFDNLTGLKPPSNINTLKVYPNPTNTYICIDNSNFNLMTGYSIKIINTLNQIIFQSAINHQQFYVDLSGWTGKGTYFVRLIDVQGNTIDVKKIVFQ